MSIEIVRQVKAEVVAAGLDLQSACGAFEITKRVAWRLRETGAGLIAKRPEQNGCNWRGGRYGVDIIMYADGRHYDVLRNAETENVPSWDVPSGGLIAPPELGRPALEPEGWGGTVPPPIPPDPPPGPDPVSAALKGIQVELLLLRAVVTDVRDRQDRVLAGGNRPFSTLKLRPEEPESK